jgi:hypothetical protein
MVNYFSKGRRKAARKPLRNKFKEVTDCDRVNINFENEETGDESSITGCSWPVRNDIIFYIVS